MVNRTIEVISHCLVVPDIAKIVCETYHDVEQQILL